MKRPQVRDDLALMEGYHSPQVEVSVRLNTNESPVPPPAAWSDALHAEMSQISWNRYPDRNATALRAGLAELYEVDPSMVFAANGSNEVLQCLLLAYGGPGRSAGLFEPTYALHSHIAKVTGTAVVEGERAPDYSLDPAEVDRVLSQEPNVVFLCSPNNPTGMVEDPDAVRSIVERVGNYGGLVVVDEAYGQFAPWSAVGLVDDDQPVAVSRTFSKTWSMAAARLGYMVAPTWVVNALESVVLPYHLDAAKQLAGTLALRFEPEMRDRVAQLVEQRDIVAAGLGELPVATWDSGANFVLFRPLNMTGDDVWEQLLARDVLVRNCASWPRLSGCLRVTIGTPEENRAFLGALGEILKP